MKDLRIITYKIENGELIKEDFYSDFLFVFNNLISHNFLNEKNQYNIIISTEFPPKELVYKNKNWEAKKNIALAKYSKLIKFFE